MSLRESQGFSPPPCRTPDPWHRPPTQPNLHSTVTTNPRNNASFDHRMNRNSREVGRLSCRSHHSCCPLVCRSNRKKPQFGWLYCCATCSLPTCNKPQTLPNSWPTSSRPREGFDHFPVGKTMEEAPLAAVVWSEVREVDNLAIACLHCTARRRPLINDKERSSARRVSFPFAHDSRASFATLPRNTTQRFFS
jgi:hypothetical protein